MFECILSNFYYMGCVDNLPQEAQSGTIYMYDKDMYVRLDDEWLLIANDDDNTIYYNKYNNYYYTESPHPSICTQCGAPLKLKSHECEYCGTVWK